jgi:hypothetical protein
MKIKKIIPICIVISLLVVINYYYIKKQISSSNKSNIQEVLNYNLHTAFFKYDEQITDRTNLKTDNNIFNYDMNIELKGNPMKFKVLFLINNIPHNFSIDDDIFSKEKYMEFSSAQDNYYNFKVEDKIEGTAIINIVFIPYEIQSNPSDFNCVPSISGIVNSDQFSKSSFENIDKSNIVGFNILDDEVSSNSNFRFLINAHLQDNKVYEDEQIIKCNAGEKISIPILGKLKNTSICSYSLFLDNNIIEFNGTLCKNIVLTEGSVFSDTITIDTPLEKGKHILWGMITPNTFKNEPFRSYTSSNFITLDVQ